MVSIIKNVFAFFRNLKLKDKLLLSYFLIILIPMLFFYFISFNRIYDSRKNIDMNLFAITEYNNEETIYRIPLTEWF